MKCIILAAGYATRLYPLTENFPKPLLRVGDKTILDWLIDDISSSGAIDRYIVVSNHKFVDHFRQWASENAHSIEVIDDGTVSNETRLGAVMDIRLALEHLWKEDETDAEADEGYLVIAGDNLLDFSLRTFISYAMGKGTSCIMRFHEVDEAKLRKCGIVETDASDRIVSMEEKPSEPKSHWVCPPFYFLTPLDARRIYDAIADGCGTDAPGSFVAWLSSHTAVHAMAMPGKRFDIGNMASYQQVQNEYEGIGR